MTKQKDALKQNIFFYSMKIIIVILFFNLLTTTLLSIFVFDNFFTDVQEKVFFNIYKQIKELDEIDVTSDAFNEIVSICKYNNCIIEVYDSSLNKRLYSPYTYETDIFASNESKQIFDLIIEGKNDYTIIDSNVPEKQEIIQALNKQTGDISSLLIRKTDNIYILVQTNTDTFSLYKTLLYKSLLWCFLLSSAIGLFPAYLLSKNMLKNINSIKKIANKIANKDFSEECIESKFNEFYDLSQAINKMSTMIETQLNEIEEKNKLLNLDIENRKRQELVQKDFISNVSHELKTPISIISGYAEGIQYGLATTKQEIDDYCCTITKECDRMKNIVKQLLDLSILENSVNLNIEQNNVSEMLNSIVERFKIKYPDRKFINSVNLNLICYFDYDEIEKVIINYIDNAIKYTNDEIDIRAFYDSNFVYIGVYSHGNIDKSDMDKIWDRFYRVDKSHKRNENSTGLGLSIVKATMNKHNMPYGVKNINDGIEFYIKLRKNNIIS